MIDHNGTVIDLGYPRDWIHYSVSASFIDHIDGFSIGNIRPDLPGLEWVITDEDGEGNERYFTALMTQNGRVWENENEIFQGLRDFREPQHTCIGNFDTTRPFSEIWVRSRLGGQGENFYRPYDSQWPWVFDYLGTLFSDYRMVETLPANFNTYPEEGNRIGLEMIWTIDWTGESKEYIAGKARYRDSHFGVFDAVTGDSVWTSMYRHPNGQAHMLYVADIAGDGREEMIIEDLSDNTLKIFSNPAANPHQPKPPKWQDPLYKRLKENWNYYSPGSYTYPDFPKISSVQIQDITASGARVTWITDTPATSRLAYGTSEALGSLTPENPALTSLHTVFIDSLSRNGVYRLQVHSRNQYGILGVSHLHTLTLFRLQTVPVQQITQTGQNQFQLSWSELTDVQGYHVYRDSQINFPTDVAHRIAVSVSDENPAQSGIQWTDMNGPSGPNFYKVTAVSGIYQSDPSAVLGVVQYPMITTGQTDFNLLGFPLQVEGFLTAANVLSKIPECNSIARWDADSQGFEQYLPTLPSSNFSIHTGQAYFVNMLDTFDQRLMGKATDLSYTLVTTPSSSFNLILLPLDRIDISSASELAQDINNCNGVACWDASAQGYTNQYDPSIPGSDFTVSTGRAYMVNVTAPTTWPGGGTPKQRQTPAPVSELRSQAPHLVFGEIPNTDSDLQLQTFLEDKTGEILTNNSPGCWVKDSFWQVQCANFSSGWKIGETLVVRLMDSGGSPVFETRVRLSSNPSDRALVTHVSKENHLPFRHALKQNHPNPFNPSTTIPYQLAKPSKVTLRILNAQGQVVRVLVDGRQSAGYKQVVWDGSNQAGQSVSGGLYVISMLCDDHQFHRKILLLK